jgi:hypothetical protein
VGEELPRQLLLLLFELLRSGDLPELVIGGAWTCAMNLFGYSTRRALGPVGLESDICGLAVAQLRALGSPDDWMVSCPLDASSHKDSAPACCSCARAACYQRCLHGVSILPSPVMHLSGDQIPVCHSLRCVLHVCSESRAAELARHGQ